jgi:lysozyme
MKTSSNGLNLIKSFEGLKLTAYSDSTGTPTIGYGHTSGVRLGQTITEAQAVAYLASDVANAEKAINKGGYNLNQNQFDALVSLLYNTGAGILPNFAAMLKADPNQAGITDKMLKYVYSKGVFIQGLANRRAKEVALYKKKFYDNFRLYNYCNLGCFRHFNYL